MESSLFQPLYRAWLALVLASCLVAGCGGGETGTGTGSVSGQAAATGNLPGDPPGATERKSVQAAVPGRFDGHGWYWNPNEGGTGFMFEAQGNRGFVAFFMYDEVTRKPLWYAAYGDLQAQADGSFAFAGDLRFYERGQPVNSPTYRVPVSRSIGQVTIRFAGNDGTVALPGGRVISGQRFNYNGLGSATTSVQPETGWYYNPAEGGRGYAIEVQNGRLFMAMFHYDDDGAPTWNVVEGDMSSGVASSDFLLYSGGQSITSAYRSPGVPLVAGTFIASFANPCAGQLQLQGVAPVSVRKFAIDGRSVPAGSECRALANGITDVPNTFDGAAPVRPGDSVYGTIDSTGDADAYRVFLRAGEAYTVDLQGAAGGWGTLSNPRLAIFGPARDTLMVDSAAVAAQLDSRLQFTASTTGIYTLQARPASGTGSFLLTVSGHAPGLDVPQATPVSAYSGAFNGVVRGSWDGSLVLAIDAAGRISGTYTVNGSVLAVSGSVSAGGSVRFSAGQSIAFSGYLGPDGRWGGAWSGGGGGVFAAAPGSTSVLPTPTRPSCYDGNVNNPTGADDPLAAQAWQLANTGQTQAVSALANAQAFAGMDVNVASVHRSGRGCTGSGVAIAVVDTDLELSHEDLAANVRPNASFNFETNGGDPTATDSALMGHGTSVAGVAAGRGWNGLGGRGIAPFASIAGYKLVQTTVLPFGTASVLSNAYYLAFGARELADASIPTTALFGSRADPIAVYNFSAGSERRFPPPVSTNPLQVTPIVQAAQFGTRSRRGGLGAVYFQSAGNGFQSVTLSVDGVETTINCLQLRQAFARGVFTNPAELSCDNSNHEPYSAPYFYRVAALHNSGRASSYSTAGATNWVSGLGGEYGIDQAAIVTTDRSGCDLGFHNTAYRSLVQRANTAYTRIVADLFGANPLDPNCRYTGRMNGTSAAAPTVSGVAALMLEANPQLSWQDVGYILARTSRRVDEGIASGTRAVKLTLNGASASVILDDPWITNAAGFSFHSRYGFGLVDAEAAVRMATTYTAPKGRRSVDAVADGPAAVPLAGQAADGTRSFSSIVNFVDRSFVSGAMRVELTLENAGSLAVNPGLLQFELVNRSTGTRSILLPAFTTWFDGGRDAPIPANGSTRLRFHSNAFYGESLAGDFEVIVRSFVDTSAAGTHVLRFAPRLTSFSM